MEKVITLALMYIGVMALGWFMKKIGIFTDGTKKSISDLVFYVTLPAMLLGCFVDLKVNFWYFIALAFGLITNGVMVLVSCVLSRNKTPEMKGIYTINGAGFNMANVAIPFLQNFFPAGIPYLCMFDVGDSFFTLGTTYAIANQRMGKKAHSPFRSIILSLVKSPSFVVYFVMTALALLQIRLPGFIIDFAKILGSGNSCLVMLMIGISLDFTMKKTAVREVGTILLERYTVGIVMALFFYCVLPAPLPMRQILASAMFASTPAVALVFNMRLGVSTEIASAMAPITAILMIPFMILAIFVIGL